MPMITAPGGVMPLKIAFGKCKSLQIFLADPPKFCQSKYHTEGW